MSAAEVGAPATTSIGGPGARSLVYCVLARCFRFPDRELVAGLLAGGPFLGVFWALNSLLEPHWPAPLTELGQWLSTRDRRTLLRQLSGDYARLFIASTRPTTVPLYESVVANQFGLAGDHTFPVTAAYREAGLADLLKQSAPADHLSTELEFMRCLAQAEHDAIQAGNQARLIWLAESQGEFLRDHLGWWVPLSMQRVSPGARTPFYRLLATATEKFVLWDLHQHASESSSIIVRDRK